MVRELRLVALENSTGVSSSLKATTLSSNTLPFTALKCPATEGHKDHHLNCSTAIKISKVASTTKVRDDTYADNRTQQVIIANIQTGGRRNIYKDLTGRPKGKRPLGRPSHRQKDIIMVKLKETEMG
jgi:hypothetical protein